MDLDQSEFRQDPLTLLGSRDAFTGQTYFPPRAYSADGRLRPTEPIELSRQGVLYSWTTLREGDFGQVDLPEGVRIQCELEPGDHAIGDIYEVCLVLKPDGSQKWRFRRA